MNSRLLFFLAAFGLCVARLMILELKLTELEERVEALESRSQEETKRAAR